MTDNDDVSLAASEQMSNTVSYTLRCNDDSRLLSEVELENQRSIVNQQRLIPSIAANNSLFSENKLLLDQD